MSSLTTLITVTDLRPPEIFQPHGLAADLRRARLPHDEEIVGPLGQRGEIVGAVAHHVLGHRAAVELRDEGRRDVVAAAGERAAGLLEDDAGGAFFLAAGELYGQLLQH